jgi:hypothetical protein
MVGGTATPTALKTLPQVPKHSVLRVRGPLKITAGFLKRPVQFFPQYQGQETTEHMPPDVLILLVIHRSGLQDGFNISEDLLHLPQFFVLECDLFC